MSLTPDDIVTYPLKQALRGYAVKQVDELLDRVADELERLHQERDDARRELASCKQRAAEAEETEAALKRTLVTAQRTAEQAVAEARQEAADIVASAERQAASIVDEATSEAEERRARSLEAIRAEETELRRQRRDLEGRVAGLRRFESDLVARLREWLREQLRNVEDLHASEPQESDPDGGGSHGATPDPGVSPTVAEPAAREVQRGPQRAPEPAAREAQRSGQPVDGGARDVSESGADDAGGGFSRERPDATEPSPDTAGHPPESGAASDDDQPGDSDEAAEKRGLFDELAMRARSWNDSGAG